MDYGPVIATLAGIAIGWGLSELSEWWRRKRHTKAIASALRHEVRAIRDRYMEVIGNQISAVPAGDYLLGSAVLEENYFTVFETNASQIGYFKPEEASQVLSFYIGAKGQLDSLRTWHEFVADLAVTPLAKQEFFDRLRSNQSKLLEAAEKLFFILEKY